MSTFHMAGLDRPGARANLARRVIQRQWLTARSMMPGENPLEGGEVGASLGDLIGDLLQEFMRGGNDVRVYRNYPAEYGVVRIFEDRQLVTARAIGSTTVFSRTIRYGWDRPKALVSVSTRDVIDVPGRYAVHHNKTLCAAAEVWKQIPTPFVP